MKSIFSDLTKETISIVFKECEKEKNKHRIENFINKITKIAFTNIQPYLYTIMAILVLMFTMNCFQFYYYIKLFIVNNKITNLDDVITRN
jgi:cell division protein FtsL